MSESLSVKNNCKSVIKQLLMRMWRKGNPDALLMGMQTGAAIMENNTDYPQKIKNGTPF